MVKSQERRYPAKTFCGLEACALKGVQPGSRGAILGVGTALGSAYPGTENGPYFIRTLAKAHTWPASSPQVLGLSCGQALQGVVDLGDLDLGERDLAGAMVAVESVVRGLPAEVAPCVIGGDHTVTHGVVQGLLARRGRPFWLVQFDHHLDLALWGATMGESQEGLFNTCVMSYVSRVLGLGRLLQLGVAPHAIVESGRLEEARSYLASVGTQISCSDPRLRDLSHVARISGTGRDVYVTVDVDVLQDSAMRSTSYPAPMGLDVRELLALIDAVVEGNRLVGFDVVEFAAPREARSARTLADGGRALMIFLHLLGHLPTEASI